MIERIEKIIDYYQLSSTDFALRIGVNQSSVSHILSNRNKPSLDFVRKILTTFEEIDPEWLIFGEGVMLKTERKNLPVGDELFAKHLRPARIDNKEIDRIIIFYKDGSFKSFLPDE